MMRPDAKVEKVYLYPKPVDFRKSIDGLGALVELDIKVAVFDPVFFVFLNRHHNRVKILYWERNGFCLWLKRLESERFKTSPDACQWRLRLRVTKPCCRGTARRHRLAERSAHLEVGGVYGALTLDIAFRLKWSFVSQGYSVALRSFNAVRA
ncbi:IS66 family insertion sequence element accessory protein TnpB [Pseudomonas hormoni]|uniref:IS66 family insertion sequence element accessory protein TnpB n=1 Tax=Pseudomonas hormoni TaxID=3093767 RepID=UPI0020298B6E|nr:IS66 family insertion sequence element accessory protein TnpB [Pseudomonas hormoni]